MRHKISTYFIILFLGFFAINPIYAENVELLDKTVVQEEVLGENEDEGITKTTPKTADIIEKSASWPYQNDLKDTVAPKTSSELFKVLNSFMKAMLGVIVCSIIIYFLALIARKFYGLSDVQNNNNTSETLKAPNNEEDALKNFLNKTR